MRLLVPEPGGGAAVLPPDQRRDALDPELGVLPPGVRRVAPRGLVPDVGAQEHRVPALQGLQPLVDHRLRHVAVGAPGEGGAGLAVRQEEQQLQLAVGGRGGGGDEAVEVGAEVGQRRVYLQHRHLAAPPFRLVEQIWSSKSELGRHGRQIRRRKKTAAEFYLLRCLRERVPVIPLPVFSHAAGWAPLLPPRVSYASRIRG